MVSVIKGEWHGDIAYMYSLKTQHNKHWQTGADKLNKTSRCLGGFAGPREGAGGDGTAESGQQWA